MFFGFVSFSITGYTCRYTRENKDLDIEREEICEPVYALDNYRINYFEYERGRAEHIVRGRMKANIDLGKSIGAPEEVLKLIQLGYKIPFIEIQQNLS